MDFKDKNALVCGLGKSGVAAARLLLKLGARVTVQDMKEERKCQEEATQLAREGFQLYLGKNPDDILAGQDLLVLSPGIPCDLPFIEKAKAMGIPIWGEVELAYRMCKCPIMAITGTNGKTTTTALCFEIIKAHNPGAVVVGNIGIPFTDKVLGLGEQDVAVAEISSFQLETALRFRPRIAAVLNVTPDHLNRHKTMENYQALKSSIFQNQWPEDYAVLNYDDPLCRDMAKGIKSKVIFFSLTQPLAEGVYFDGTHICVSLFGINRQILSVDKLQIFGNHNIENALAAVAMTLCAGVPLSIITAMLQHFKGVEHRIEFVTEINGIKFYNDSKATNTDAAIKSLEAIKAPIVLICGGYDKNADFSEWIKKFEGHVRHAVVLGQVSQQIMDTCRAYNYETVDRVNTLKEAVEVGFAKAQPGDCVLLSPACASFDMFDNYEQRGRLFKDFVWEMRG